MRVRSHLIQDHSLTLPHTRHMCMAMRGVQKPGSATITSAYLGAFQENPQLKTELFSHMDRKSLF